MAIIPKNDYTGRINSTDPEYPQGKAINIIGTTVGTGTPVEEKWLNDDWGFKQEILEQAGITPSGAPDKVGASQYLEGIKKINTKDTLNDLSQAYEVLNVDLLLADAIVFPSGKILHLFDRDCSFKFAIGGTPDGFGVLDAGNGNTATLISTSRYRDPIWYGASVTDKTKNAPVLQQMLDTGIGIISGKYFEVDAEVTVPTGARLNFLGTGGVYCSDGFMTSGTGKSLLICDVDANDIVIEGTEFNGNAGAIDFAKWPNTDATGNEASVGLTRPVKLVVHQNSKVKYRGCRFLNTVGGAVKEFAATGQREIDIDDCYWDLIRGNCVDGNYEKLVMTRQQVNLTGDIRLATRGGLIVTACDDALITNIHIRQTTDSSIYLSGSDRGKAVVSDVFIRYSGKDAVKVLTGTKDSIFGNINVTAAGKTPVGFFGGTVANGVLGTIKIGFSEGDAPTNILDQTDVTWSTPKTITACNIQEAKWNQGGGSGGFGFAIADSNVAFSTISISSYTGFAASTSATKIAGGSMSVSFGDGSAIYASTSDFNLDNLVLHKTNQNALLTPLDSKYAIDLRGTSDINITTVNFSELGGGLLFTGPDSKRLNLDNVVGDTFNTKALSDTHLIYANSVVSTGTVTDVNISNVAVTGSATAGRILWARNCKKLNITNWGSEGGTEGIRVADCSQVNLSNIIANTSARDGVRVSGSSNVSLMSVQGHDNLGVGVKVDSDCVDIIVLGCQGTGNGTNLSIFGTNVKPAVIADFNIS